MTLYSLVACQNRLKFGEQKRVFRMVPGLENAEFVRYGVIHRNTYVEAPHVPGTLARAEGDTGGCSWRANSRGSRATWKVPPPGCTPGSRPCAGLRGLRNRARAPRPCAYGSLSSHLQDATPREFAPMNINWGLFPEPEVANPRDKDLRREAKLAAAGAAFAGWRAALEPG